MKKLQQINAVLIFCFIVIAGLYYGASVLIPITFAVFLSTLVLPFCKLLEGHFGMGRIISSLLSTLVLFLGIGIVIFVLFRQLSVFINDLLEQKEDILQFINMLQERMMSVTGITLQEQEELFRDRLSELLQEAQSFLSKFLTDFTGILFSFLLILIYVFLLLLNRDKFVEFFMEYFPEDSEDAISQILSKSKKVANQYLWGRIQVMLVLGILYTITFIAYDLEYAVLLIVFGVLITIIPYLGPLLSGLLPVLFMITFSNSPTEIISFAALVLVIQLIESYFLEPLIIGSEIQQSPFFVIIAIIIGGAIWGFAGLILFVPLFAILKIIFDHSPGLKPVGFLMGYERPGSGEDFLQKIKKKLKK